VRDISLTVDTSISGKVLDDRGQPLEHAAVGLIRLSGVAPSGQEAIFSSTDTRGSDMSFTFTNIPLGRYLIVFNPGGPSSRWTFESSYYPLGASRAAARAVELNSVGVHLTGLDLAAGKRVGFREVTVRVRFSDGAPMSAARVESAGLPLSEGNSRWFHVALVETKTGLARFSAPANRSLELKVTDPYRRDLRAEYRSKHEAGTTPIHQEFVIRP
jgi:hypothetical protein